MGIDQILNDPFLPPSAQEAIRKPFSSHEDLKYEPTKSRASEPAAADQKQPSNAFRSPEAQKMHNEITGDEK